MKFLLRVVAISMMVGFFFHALAMMTPMSDKEVAKDSIVGIPALSQALQKINLRAYAGTTSEQDENIKKKWDGVIGSINKMITSTTIYDNLKPLFNNMKNLSDGLFNSTGMEWYYSQKGDQNAAILEKLSKKQGQVKRFLLGQKAKSFFSFGKKQEEYKNMKQLILGMIDMLNAKIDLMKKSVK